MNWHDDTGWSRHISQAQRRERDESIAAQIRRVEANDPALLTCCIYMDLLPNVMDRCIDALNKNNRLMGVVFASVRTQISYNGNRFRRLMQDLRSIPTLRLLELVGCSLGDTEAKILSQELLADNKTLLGLFLGLNNIGQVGGRSIARALPESALIDLRIFQNRGIDDDVAEELAASLRQQSTPLQYLNLRRDCSISDRGATALASATKQNNTLVRMDLDGNRIGLEGQAAFVDSLEHCNYSTESLVFSSLRMQGVIRRICASNKAIRENLSSFGSYGTRSLLEQPAAAQHC